MTSFLVTGGAGFIGSHVVELLIQEGCSVTVYDSLCTGKLSNIEHINSDSLKVIIDDVRNENSLEKAADGIECIIHLAALVSVPESIQHPMESFKVNAAATVSVLEVARKKGIKNVVLASSAAVYGNCSELTISEEEMTAPLSPYGLDKLTAENYGRLYANLYDLNVTALRFFNVFGPRQDPNSPYSGVISIFIKHILKGTSPTIFGDGEQSRDFVSVDDVARSLYAASKISGFNVINVGTGRGIKIHEIWKQLQILTGSKQQELYQPPRKGDIRHSIANITKLKNRLDITPQIDFEAGLATTYKCESRKSQQNSNFAS